MDYASARCTPAGITSSSSVQFFRSVSAIFIWLVIAVVSGWFELLPDDSSATQNPAAKQDPPDRFFTLVYMRYWCHYSSVIRMTAAEDAFYLSVLLAFPRRTPSVAHTLERNPRCEG